MNPNQLLWFQPVERRSRTTKGSNCLKGSQSFSKACQLFLKESRLFTVISNLHKTEENHLKQSPCTRCATKRFSKHSLATSSHTKPSKSLSCQVGQSKTPTKDHRPKSAPTPSHQKQKTTQKQALGDPHPDTLATHFLSQNGALHTCAKAFQVYFAQPFLTCLGAGLAIDLSTINCIFG